MCPAQARESTHRRNAIEGACWLCNTAFNSSHNPDLFPMARRALSLTHLGMWGSKVVDLGTLTAQAQGLYAEMPASLTLVRSSSESAVPNTLAGATSPNGGPSFCSFQAAQSETSRPCCIRESAASADTVPSGPALATLPRRQLPILHFRVTISITGNCRPSRTFLGIGGISDICRFSMPARMPTISVFSRLLPCPAVE